MDFPIYCQANPGRKAYRRKGQYNQAIIDHGKAIEINPRYTKAYLSRAITYVKIDQLDRAISDFNKVIEQNPRYASAYKYRGLAFEKKANMTKLYLITPGP